MSRHAKGCWAMLVLLAKVCVYAVEGRARGQRKAGMQVMVRQRETGWAGACKAYTGKGRWGKVGKEK